MSAYLTVNEANAVDEVIRLYKLSLALTDDDSQFVDCESSEVMSVQEGLSEILDAVDADLQPFLSLSDSEREAFISALASNRVIIVD